MRSLLPIPILVALFSCGTRSGRVCSVLGVSVDVVRSGSTGGWEVDVPLFG